LVARATDNDDASNRPVSKLKLFFCFDFFLPDTAGSFNEEHDEIASANILKCADPWNTSIVINIILSRDSTGS
jgi:hypothetical protein